MSENLNSLLKRLGIEAKNSQIFQTAFTHRSYLNEFKGAKESNERLEFLGDSVLSLVVSSYLFQTRSLDQEGELTNLRAYIVKTESLAKVALKLGLGNHLRMSKGEELSGGRENPQLLANTFEALLGAIYVDLGLEGVSVFVHHHLLPTFGAELKSGAPKDKKSELQEIAQSKFQFSPRYKILKTKGPDHAKHFTVGVQVGNKLVGQGEGPNKQAAEEEAAKQALSKLSSQ